VSRTWGHDLVQYPLMDDSKFFVLRYFNRLDEFRTTLGACVFTNC